MRRRIWSSGLCLVCDRNIISIFRFDTCLCYQALGWTMLSERCPFMWRSSLTPTLESTRLQSKVRGLVSPLLLHDKGWHELFIIMSDQLNLPQLGSKHLKWSNNLWECAVALLFLLSFLCLCQWWLPTTCAGRLRGYFVLLWRSLSSAPTSVTRRGSTPPSPRTTAGLPNTTKRSLCE